MKCDELKSEELPCSLFSTSCDGQGMGLHGVRSTSFMRVPFYALSCGGRGIFNSGDFFPGPILLPDKGGNTATLLETGQRGIGTG